MNDDIQIDVLAKIICLSQKHHDNDIIFYRSTQCEKEYEGSDNIRISIGK